MYIPNVVYANVCAFLYKVQRMCIFIQIVFDWLSNVQLYSVRPYDNMKSLRIIHMNIYWIQRKDPLKLKMRLCWIEKN